MRRIKTPSGTVRHAVPRQRPESFPLPNMTNPNIAADHSLSRQARLRVLFCITCSCLLATAGAGRACLYAQPTGAAESKLASYSYSNLPTQPVGPDDLLALSVYDSPELTRTVRVDANGNIRLPMLKDPIQVQRHGSRSQLEST